MNLLAKSRVAVVGLGLMGGSLAGALRARCHTVVGLARRDETVAAARHQGLIDDGTTNPQVALRKADIVVLATPVRTIIQQLTDLAPHLPAGCLVMDLGSTKREVLAAMAELPLAIQPLGAHPMCGLETSGLDAANPSLYQGCTFILCPLERTSREALALGEALARAVGATPLCLDGERHDVLVATLSHLSYLIACSLVQTATVTTSHDPAAWRIVAGGFRDTSRVAGSDVKMMLDILSTNRAAVLQSAAAFRSQLDRLVHLIASGGEQPLAAFLEECRSERRRMYG